MKTVIEMAREAAAVHGHTFKAVPSPETIEFITAFAELVRADERARMAEQPAQQEPVATLFGSLPVYDTPPPAAQQVIPDAMTSADIQEHIEYVAGWNDCRQAMLEMMK